MIPKLLRAWAELMKDVRGAPGEGELWEVALGVREGKRVSATLSSFPFHMQQVE